eukprot:gene4057-4715_t
MEESYLSMHDASNMYLSLGYDQIEVKGETPSQSFFSDQLDGSKEFVSSPPMMDMHNHQLQQQQQQQQQLMMMHQQTQPNSSVSTPLMPSKALQMGASIYPHADTQTHEHFLKLLSQIQQTQQTLSTYQTTHDFINAQTAIAVAASSTSDQSSPSQQTSFISSDSTPPATSVSSPASIQPIDLVKSNNSLSTADQPQSSTQSSAVSTTPTEATLTIAMPTKKNIKASAIASPPNSPRKNSRNSKVKHKTQQVQHNIQQAQMQQQAQQQAQQLAQQQQQQLNSVAPPFKLSGSPISSPPQSPITPPPLPPVPVAAKVKNSRKTAPPTGPSVVSIINQLGLHPFVNNTNNNQSPSFDASNNTPIIAPVQTTTNNEDKKTVCLSFLKYYFNVNPTLTTPTLRRSLILSLYVNKISQELRYRRPNDMANLCVVLYGHLFSSLDDATIKEFINSHSSSIQKSKKDDKKRKRKRDKEEATEPYKFSQGDKQQSLRSPLQRSVNGANASPTFNQSNNNENNDAQWSTAPIQTTPSYFAYDVNSASPDNSNGVLSPSSLMPIVSTQHTNGSPQSFIDSPDSKDSTSGAADDDSEISSISLHDSFINCLKSCTLLPFLEFKPVHTLVAPADLPITDYYYTYDDLIRWENELKDLKFSWRLDPKNGVLVNVFENKDSFIIYVAIPHSRPNTLRVTVNQLEVIVEGTVSIPDTIFLPNGAEMVIPIAYPPTFQKQEFFVGNFVKHIHLNSPVSSSVVGKREGIVVIIARKEMTVQL